MRILPFHTLGIQKSSNRGLTSNLKVWLGCVLWFFCSMTHGASNQASSRNSGLWEMYQRVEQLQKELQQLRGVVEEQAYRLELLQKQQKGQYLDLDQRVQSLVKQVKMGKAKQVEKSTVSVHQSVSGADYKQEKVVYDNAKAFVEKRELEKAAQAFQALLQEYPQGAFTAYSHYWLGEIYIALKDPQMEKAKTHFETVLDKYPNHPKEGATLFKLGKLYHMQGDNSKAKALLNRAKSLDPSSRVAKLAEQYLQKM